MFQYSFRMMVSVLHTERLRLSEKTNSPAPKAAAMCTTHTHMLQQLTCTTLREDDGAGMKQATDSFSLFSFIRKQILFTEETLTNMF